ncbi:glycosyltransferase family 2 protein [Nostoc sp. FACHB-87]|uniref:glycosyltransferase n=1 Tax=Nostocaceae TaxID=1162 RepID=UPI001689C5AF|nr:MULTISPECIES: glycosyltransferase [Nostocaceae]MBD2452904.1 glycosyltransferase family 2 protein [Nostoc sp. FACHB-87]MBD2473835.1 glycosyltransferase family 2 protein [Anabaena sp. FACHB-83]
MNPLVSVIIPTHNPNYERLQKTLNALKKQTLLQESWELIVIDNLTPDPTYIYKFDFSWHNYTKVVREEKLGLTRARIAGIKASQGKYLVFVDDDNVLDANYLKNVIDIFHNYPHLGAIGGKSLPDFEVEPESWVKDFWVCLALRNLGEEIQIYAFDELPKKEKQHPSFAPIGAGMALQRQAALLYVDSIAENINRLSLDRTGKSLQSGGDCDINLTLLEAGWAVGYFPQLQLTHLISANRLTKDYLARLNRASLRSWVQVLDAHNIHPWQKIPSWSVIPRQIKAFFSYQPWKSPANYINWQGACGMFEGLGTLSANHGNQL